MKAPKVVYIDAYDNMVFCRVSDVRYAIEASIEVESEYPIAKYVLSEVLYPKPKKGAKK